MVDFLLVLIELFFASSHGIGAMSGYLSKLWLLKGGWLTFSANFRGKEGHPPTTLASKNYGPWAVRGVALFA